jgi:ribosomal protein S18 acetylase RimI-like enzyme
VIKLYENNPKGFFVISSKGEQQGWVFTELNTESSLAFVVSLYITARARNEGVGTKVAEIVMAKLKDRGINTVRFQSFNENEDALAFFDKNFNYRPIKKSELFPEMATLYEFKI